MLSPEIVYEIKSEHLKKIYTDNKPIYSSSEANFLKEYCPYYFDNISLSEQPSNPALTYEIMLSIFNIIVRLDISVFHGKNLEDLAKEKAEQMNPIFESYRIEKVNCDLNYLEDLCTLKNKGLEVLKKGAQKIDKNMGHRFNEKERVAQYIKNPKKVNDVRDSLLLLFGNFPIILYGSVLQEKNPNDIDTRVIIDNLTPKIYEKIEGKYNEKNPFDFVLVPKQYSIAFDTFDPGNVANPENSILINGNFEYPVLKKSHLDSVKLHNIAISILQLRESLTSEGLKKCSEIIRRINSRLKMPKFIARNLSYVVERSIDKPTVKQLKDVPEISTLVNHLIEANMATYDIMKTHYYSQK